MKTSVKFTLRLDEEEAFALEKVLRVVNPDAKKKIGMSDEEIIVLDRIHHVLSDTKKE